jgi:2-keto-4-pentenoate hydratase/2-oxohepta-3-ene-1,7-dioic acid hydratase in catechol pathway
MSLTKVNGQTRQKDSAGKMHFKIDYQISYLSQFFKLQEGDMILTGTPDGVGPVKAGDKCEGYARIGDKVIASLNFNVTA